VRLGAACAAHATTATAAGPLIFVYAAQTHGLLQ
jgi:hypothetical protein